MIKSKTVRNIYEGPVARKYDLSMSHFFARLKEKAFTGSSIRKGDQVLVFCCGTGLDFAPILKRIGKEGQIVGVDFSEEMLMQAQHKIDKNNWKNIELIQADVTEFREYFNQKFDAGVCTLGLSIIPDYKGAYYNLYSNVKPDGELIIGDMQLASGWQAKFNPLTIAMARRYGGTRQGHQNSLEIIDTMRKELIDVRLQSFFMKSYYYCIGKKKT